jgi:1-aminocyclopropane-1-carboxylate deaminase/D-cysteine desulfhydrase-like pyridoxal-dependent ACC family enzyme
VKEDLTLWRRRYQSELDVESLHIRVIEGYVGPGYAQADQGVYDTIKLAAQLEGILLDPTYSGKTFAVLLDMLRRGDFAADEHVVFLHTGGAVSLFGYPELVDEAD